MKTEMKVWALTGSFEGSGYGELTGNFDGQGWSGGILCFATGQGKLQKLVRLYHDNGPETFKRCCTVEVEGRGVIDLSPDLLAWTALTVPKAVAWCAARCEGRLMHPLEHWEQAFENFGNEPGYQAIQREYGKPYMDRAYAICAEFGFKTERGLAQAFDIAVQNGSVKVAARAAFQKMDPGVEEIARLRAMAQAVSEVCNPRWRSDVYARKITCANGIGRVHGRDYDLQRDFGIGPLAFA